MDERQALKFLVFGVNENENITIGDKKYEKVRVHGAELDCDEITDRYYISSIFYQDIAGYHNSPEAAMAAAKNEFGDLFNEQEMFYYKDITPDPNAIDWSKYL